MFVWKMGPSTIQKRGQCNLVLEFLMTKLLLQLRREVQRHKEGRKTQEAPQKIRVQLYLLWVKNAIVSVLAKLPT